MEFSDICYMHLRQKVLLCGKGVKYTGLNYTEKLLEINYLMLMVAVSQVVTSLVSFTIHKSDTSHTCDAAEARPKTTM